MGLYILCSKGELFSPEVKHYFTKVSQTVKNVF